VERSSNHYSALARLDESDELLDLRERLDLDLRALDRLGYVEIGPEE
jgi:hypothetical protein